MKARDLFCNILFDFEHKGDTTIIKVVEKHPIFVFFGVEIKYESVTIIIAEYIKELAKHGFSVDDYEVGLVLYHLIKLFWTSTEEIILDFENVTNVIEPYEELFTLISESLERLSYEYGNLLKKHIKTINVPDKGLVFRTYKTLIEDAILSYKNNMSVYKDNDNKDEDKDYIDVIKV